MTSKPRIVCIVQARMLSTRLPGKVLLPLQGKPLLQYQIERLKRSTHIDTVSVATAEGPECGPIVSWCNSLGVPVTRGDEQDVLSRFVKCATEQQAELIVRVTSDCPLIDPALIDMVIDNYLTGAWDFCALDIPDSYPRGLDCEVFSAEHLFLTDREANEKHYREHVAPYLYKHSERFRCTWLTRDTPAKPYRFCVDTPEDFELVTNLAQALSPDLDFSWEDIVGILDNHPAWAGINAKVVQKTV